MKLMLLSSYSLNDKANSIIKTLATSFVCWMNGEEKPLFSFRTKKEAAAE